MFSAIVQFPYPLLLSKFSLYPGALRLEPGLDANL
jgi:hypothetical protein